MLPLIPILIGLGAGAAAWGATTYTASEVADAMAPKGPLVNVGSQTTTTSGGVPPWIWIVLALVAYEVWRRSH